MKNLKTLILIAAIAVLFNSCAKDGAPGATGPAGANGTNGTNGNANVTYQTFTITPGSWSGTSGIFSSLQNDAGIIDATKDLVDVDVSTNQSTFFGCPISSYLAGGDDLSYAFKNGQITFIYLNSTAPTQTLYFKVTVIPPM